VQHTSSDFFASIAEGTTNLLRGVLRESGYSLFRKGPEVVFGKAPTGSDYDYHLVLVAQSVSELEKGTFNVAVPPDRFLVYRNPSRITISFALMANGLPSSQALRAHDKLYSYFFDNRAIDAFLPESLRGRVGLCDRLTSQKAELRMKVDPDGDKAWLYESVPELFLFQFDYLALFHSGNPLREEVRTKQRVIDYSTDPSLIKGVSHENL
jgi:hypothetical protein